MRVPACFILVLVSSAAFAASSDMRWQFDGISLIHGVPQTDDSDFSASCATGKTVIHLYRAAPGLTNGGAVALAAGSFSGRYASHGVMSDEAGVALPELTVPSGDGLVDAMAKGRSLRITMDGAAAYDISLQGSRVAVARFAAACGHSISSPRPSRGK
ncbi:MAG TPA: hypothetical protein VFQ52_09375 [Rhizomicrobium sp.]|nr:hypothetical protein [Rhizomicrobium sp.]